MPSAAATGRIREHDDEPFSRPPDLLQARRRRRSPTATASPPTRIAAGRTAIASAGSTTRSCARPTARTAPARARGRSTSRAASSPGRRSRPTIRARGPDLPNHEPRGCSRGASYSWYLYSGNRVKYPLVRSRLLKLWREARATAHAGRGLGVDRRGSGEARSLHQQARPRRLRARDLGRGDRDHRRRQRLHGRRPTAPTASSASRRSRRCRWSPTPPARAICR